MSVRRSPARPEAANRLFERPLQAGESAAKPVPALRERTGPPPISVSAIPAAGVCAVRRTGVWQLERPVHADRYGLSTLYHARAGTHVLVSRSVRALCEELGSATLDVRAATELLAFGLIFGEKTLVREVKVLAPQGVLEPDGTVRSSPRFARERSVTSAQQAADAILEKIAKCIAEHERHADLHLSGLSAGLDTRILATLPKSHGPRWSWLNVSSAGTSERTGAQAIAGRLGLGAFRAVEPRPAAYLEPGELRVGVDLTSGALSAHETGILRYHFERHRAALDPQRHRKTIVWSGALGDALIGPSYLKPANTLYDAVGRPPLRHLRSALSEEGYEAFRAEEDLYHSNPYSMETRSAEERGYLLRLLTRGRRYICGTLSQMFSRVGTTVCPFLESGILDIVDAIAPEILRQDRVRAALLERLVPGSSTPVYRVLPEPRDGALLARLLAEEVPRSAEAARLLSAGLLAELASGRPPCTLPFHRGDGPARALLRVSAAAFERLGLGEKVVRRVGRELGVRSTLKFYDRLLAVLVFFRILRESRVTVEESL